MESIVAINLSLIGVLKYLRLVLLDGGSMYECLASWLYFFLEFTIKVALDGRCASLCMHAWLAGAA